MTIRYHIYISAFRRTVAFAILVLSLSAMASGQWLSVNSQNFYVAGEVSGPEINTAAVRLEQFRDAFEAIFPKTRAESRVPTTVLIFRDPASYRPYRPRRPDGTPDDAVAGYFIASEGQNYITLSITGGKADPYQTIFHEYIHFLMRSYTGRDDLPAWLGEGIAQYYETMRVMDEGTVMIGDPPQGRLVTLKRGAMLPWGQFFATERGSLHGTADDARSMFYAQSWLLVHYLMNSGTGRPDEKLDRLLSSLGRGGSVETALKDGFKIEIAGLDERLRSYAAQAELPVVTQKLSGIRREFAVSNSQRLSDAAAKALLGDLLLATNRLDEAEALLRAAISADAGLGAARASLGILLLRKGKAPEALRHLEFAVSKGKPGHYELFNYAYALGQTSGSGGMISEFPEAVAAKMRDALRRAIEIEPRFAESYRLLAFVEYIEKGDDERAESLLRKGLELSPGSENFEILLARVLLRQEKFDEARKLAERLRTSGREPQVRQDAAEILASAVQFDRARLQVTATGTSGSYPWSPRIVLLKRSWVGEGDVAAIERSRQLTNLNRMLEPLRTGEVRVLGTIDRIDCTRGKIIYTVRSGGGSIRLSGERFDDLRMAVLISGSATFQVDCGARLSSHPAVLSFVPGQGGRTENARLTSVTFVPDDFELYTEERLAAARQVVIENDLLRRSREAAEGYESLAVTSEGRWSSISRDLRKVKAGERRFIGVLDEIECTETGYTAIARVNGRRMRLTADPQLVPAWFGIEASQVPLSCGARPNAPNVLFTAEAETDSTNAGRLVAMEFLPAGFPVETVTGPGR